MFAIGFDQFNDIGIISSANTPHDVKIKKLLVKCKGTFKERYNCKGAIIRASGRDSFNYWSKKFAITFAPPLILYISFQLWLLRVESDEEKERRERRIIRLKKKREQQERAAAEEGRQRRVSAQRRQAVNQANQRARREEKKAPLNIMVVTQDEHYVEFIQPMMWENGYNLIQSDLGDVFLSYREINFHVILTDIVFVAPEIHPDDVNDPEFSVKVMNLKETNEGLRARKKLIRIIATDAKFKELPAQEFIKSATDIGADAVIEKPFEPTKLIALIEKLGIS